MKNPIHAQYALLSRLVRHSVKLRHVIAPRMSVKTIGSFVSLALSFALLLQGSVFIKGVQAQKRQKVGATQPRVGGKADDGQIRTTGRAVLPVIREIGRMGPINVEALSQQLALGAGQTEPAQLRPIHAPRATEERASSVAIRRGDETSSATASPQAPTPTIPSPPVKRSFRGDTFQFGSIPPDTMGAVGDNHIVTVTNEKFRVTDKHGQLQTNVTLDAFWASTSGLPNPNTFDPKVVYDRFNDRFIMVAVANAFAPDSATLIATSQTPDPNGNWDRYFIDADPLAVAGGGNWADFPSLGFNSNWITVQINLFGFGSVVGYQGPAIYVLNKADAYNGAPATFAAFQGSLAVCNATPPTAQGLELGCGFTMVPHVAEDNLSTTQYLIENWNSTSGQLRISTLTGTAAAPVLAVGTQFPQSTHSWRFNALLIAGSGGYVPQRQQNLYAASGNRPTANDARISNAVFRNGTLWATHHVMLAATPTLAGTSVGGSGNPDVRAAIQWWQIDPTIVNSMTGTLPLQRGRIEDPLADNCHNGSGGNRAGCTTALQVGDHYTFPSIAVNKDNDVLIGYSRFSPLTLPKGAYSFRKATDAPNTMRDSQVMREGVGNYNIGAGSPFNIRWGDYSAAMVDPLNDTEFWTTQEFGNFHAEIFGPGGFAGNWATWWALVDPNATSSYSGSLIINEFRLLGPAGSRDEFVELYNPGTSPVTVSTSDNSDGWALVHVSPSGTVTALAVIPNGTTIPAGGHYLIANSVAATGIAPYSLNAYPNTGVRASDADAFYTVDSVNNGGLALFRSANAANFTAPNRLDSVGFVSTTNALYKEGAGIPDITGSPASNISFVRRWTSGAVQDTGNNAADFLFVSTTAEVLGVPSVLGSPGPQNLDSAYVQTSQLPFTLLDPSASHTASPNRVRDLTPDPGNNSTNGTMTIRRTVVNNTGKHISRLRFRIIDITGAPMATGFADIRARTSTGPVTVAITGPNPACPGNVCTVQGLTLEEPALQPMGGGMNSTLSAGTITLAATLDAGARINIQFLLGVQTTGSFRFFVNVEALP